MIFLGLYIIYKKITSEEERKIYRTKIIKQYEDKKKVVKDKNENSKFQQEMKKTGINLSAFRYQVYRWIFLIITILYYLFTAIINTTEFDRSVFAIPLLLLILTEPKFKWSLVNILVEILVKRKKKQRLLELFTLFDILKADLNSLGDHQEVNIYDVLREVIPMFENINGTISRFLSIWRTSPSDAKNIFEKEIGGESAKVLGEVLYKMDSTSKTEALQIIESEASVFSYSFFEGEMQGSVKKKNGFFILFSINIILILAWLLTHIFTMLNDNLNNTNF
jgi:hypothetical protein